MQLPQDSSLQYQVSRPHPDDDEIDLGKIAKTLWRGKWIVALCTFFSLLIAADQVYRVEVPLYSATASVVLEADSQSSINISDFDPSLYVDWYTLGTQNRILYSRHLAEKVVLSEGLLEDPYFNGYAEEANGRRVSGSVGLFDLPGIAANRVRKTIDALLPKEPGSESVFDYEPTETDILMATADAALSVISVSNDTDTYVYDITATTPFPETSAMLATAWAEAYVQDQRDVKIDETQRTTTWLGEQAGLLKTQLETSEEDLSRFTANIDLINADSLNFLNQQLKLTRDRLEREQENSEDLRALLAALQASIDAREPEFPTQNLTLGGLAPLPESRTDAAPSNTQSLSPEQETRRMRDLQRDLRASEQRQRALSEAIEDLEMRVSVQSEELVKFEQMTREVEANRVIYEFFLTKLREVSIQSETLQADSRVLSQAVVPDFPVSPRKSRTLALAIILGSMLGVGIVLGMEYLNTRFRTPEELSEKTGYLVMGAIPDIKKPNRREILRFVRNNKLSRTAEAFRNLRTSLLLSNVDKTPKVIMITSATAGEGKSTVTVGLASSFAGMDKKVLLVECDIRRQTFTEYFGKQREHGLISVLAGQAEIHDCLHHDTEIGCDILFADSPTVNSVDLFSSDKFRELLHDAAEEYDIVLLDTPPVLIVSDARVIAPLTDARLFVAQWNKTTAKNVQRGLQSLEEIGARATGLVMSRVSLKGMRSYSDRSDPSYNQNSSAYYHEA